MYSHVDFISPFVKLFRMRLIKISVLVCLLLALIHPFMLEQNSNEILDSLQGVGYRVGQVESYKRLKTSGKSALYEIVAPTLDDGRPIKLLNLSGSHYDAGFDYGFMLADQIQYSYKSLFDSQLNNNTLLIKVMQTFLDWQYHSFVRKSIPYQFINELKGIKDGAFKSKKIKNINKLLQRVLVISNFPGALQHDIPDVLFDEFLKNVLQLQNQQIQNYVQSNIIYVIDKIKQFVQKNAIMCSFFGVWGNRTKDGDLYTMRNLDWASNTGINLNKLVVVFNIEQQIPHAILGFPGLIGALTGISAKGITVHEAGQSSDLETMEGFQWTLRMRYIMMKANNLNEGLKLWNQTKNTLGMNFMIGSAVDKKAAVIETMRDYSAIFYDNDPRQNRTIFTDEKGNKYVGGFSMPNAVFRTNHAYDPIIQKHSHTKLLSKNSDTMIRYLILKDMFNSYNDLSIQMTDVQALNVTAVLGDKGSEKFYSCQNNYKGLNVISVLYQPSKLKMWAAFEYGFKDTFRSACCGVYVEIDLTKWFAPFK